MLRYPSLLGALMLLAAAVALPARSQEHDQTGKDQPRAGQTEKADAEPPTSIFNDRLRRFKFRLEHDVATVATAEQFMVRYNRPDNPRIIGAYPDAETNSLVVIGPPESEQAIRENLAQWVVASQGFGQGPPLSMQLRLLEHQRTDLLEIMAGEEVAMVKAAASNDERAKEKQIASRLQAFEGELKVVEQQIRIVRKYIDRLQHDDPVRR
jgi:hypothetical protein